MFDREFKVAKDRWKVIVVIKNGYVLLIMPNVVKKDPNNLIQIA